MKRLYKALIKIFLAILILIPVACKAQFDEEYCNRLHHEKVSSDTKIKWSQFGPGNAGFTNFLRYHPTTPGLCITSPDMYNTYQTEDNGASWYTIKDYDGNGKDLTRLADAYYSSKVSSFGLAIECAELYKTNNTGKKWEMVTHCPWYDNDNKGYDKKGWYTKVSTLAIDPNDENVWYVGSGAHPRGQSHLSWNCMTSATAASPRGRENIKYNVPFQGKIWRTDNAGGNWTELTSGINEKAQFCRIIVHPENSNVVFAASTHGISKSTDKGATWTDIGEGKLDNNTIMDMDFYYDKASSTFILYVIDQVRYQPSGNTTTNTGGIFKTEDEGQTWTNINSNLHLNVNQLTGGVSGNYYKYIARWFGISESDAKTKYGTLPTDMLQYFNSLNTDPTDSDIMYVGFYDAQVAYSITPGRLWKTSNRGNSWINVARDYAKAWSNDKEFWEARNNPYTDNMEEGHHLTNQQWGEAYPLRSLRHCAVGANGDVMLLYAHNTFLSTDKGESWQQVDETYTPDGNLTGHGNSNHPGSCIFQDKRLGAGITYMGSGEHKLWRTTNDGEDGKQAVKFLKNSAETVFALTTHPWDEKTVYTTSMRQHRMENIMKSTDAGESWDVWGEAADGTEYFRTNSLLVDPINPDNIYFCVNHRTGADKNKQGGVFVSTNAGKEFARRNTGLPNFARTVDIEFDPTVKDYSALYAAVQFNKDNGNIDGGLFYTNNRGVSWTEIEINSAVRGVNSITFDHIGRIYVTTGRDHWDRNASYKEGGIWYSDDKGATWSRIFKIENAFQFDVSPFDNNLLICAVSGGSINPGIYLSEDRGATWSKNNDTNGQPDKITDVQFDIHDETRIHKTVLGSGFFKGEYPAGADARKITIAPESAIITGDPIQATVQVSGGLSASDIRYKSGNTDIATVSETGLITGQKAGAVKIYATSADGRYSDYVYLVVKSIVSSNELTKASALNLYPNPAKGELFIETTFDSNAQFYNMDGKQVKTTRLKQGVNIVDLSGLSSGIYVVKTVVNGSVVSKKFTILQ